MIRTLNKMDKPLLILSIVMFIFGLFMILDASSMKSFLNTGENTKYFFRQLSFLILAAIFSITIIRLPLKRYNRLIYTISFALICMLLYLLIAGTETSAGVKSWIYIGKFGLQPSEFAKVALILFTGIYYQINQKRLNNFVVAVIPLALGAIFTLLTLLQPDGGTGLILFLISIILFYSSKVDKKIKINITFALLNYTYGTNGIDLPSDKPWIVNMMDKDKVTKDIKEARANADVVIVFPHWGTENSFGISDYQKEYTDLFSKLGVDLVIGCHPHVIEPVKEVTNESGHKMLVYYSLGNFISHQIEIDQLCGGIASVDIEKKNGKITVNGKFIPIVTHYNRTDGDKFRFDVYKLSDYTDELAKSHSQNGGTPEYYNKLVKKVIDEKYLDLS